MRRVMYYKNIIQYQLVISKVIIIYNRLRIIMLFFLFKNVVLFPYLFHIDV